MIKPLRKRHLQIWTILAVMIPVGLLAAWFSIPQQAKDKLLQPASGKALPVLLKVISSGDAFEINLRANADTSQLQLEWINKQTLVYPTAAIYKMPLNDTDIRHGNLVGRIEARGVYYFPVDSTFKINGPSGYQLLVFDFIHRKIIDSITFKQP